MAVKQYGITVGGNIKHYICDSNDNVYPGASECGAGSTLKVINAITGKKEAEYFFTGSQWINENVKAAYDSADDAFKIKSMQKKFRESWSGTTINANKWDVTVGTGMTATVSGGLLTITAGLTVNSETTLVSKEVFTIPFKLSFGLGLSQRTANQSFIVEAVSCDPDGAVNEKAKAGFLFDGASATSQKYVVRNDSSTGDVATAGTMATTAGTVSYFEIEPFADEAWFHSGTIDSNVARTASFRKHKDIPDPNMLYKIRIKAANGASAPVSNTVMTIPFICCNDYAEITAEITSGRGQTAAGQSMAVQVAGTAAVSGTVSAAGTTAHDAAGTSVNPVKVGGRAVSSAYTTVSSGDLADLITTLQGVLITKLNQIPELSWQYYALITSAVSQTAKAAGASGIRNYVTDIQLINTGGTATTVQIVDGLSTILWQIMLPANMTVPLAVTFQTQLRGTAATNLNINTGAAGNVYVNVQGYQAT